ncbi:hypothetical protein QL285_027636 [Trifolium repens]|nr:hypothetical protein QL285_027636 [Trifolium repens]
MENPDANVDPLSQVIVAGKAGGRGTKRGRKAESASPSHKAAKLDGGVENIDDDAGDEDQGERSPPKVKGGRTTRRRAASSANQDEPMGDVMKSVAAEGESSKREALPTWNEDFDPIAFVADNLKGCTSRLDALSLEELRKLAVRTGLKCLALNQMVYARQEKEASEKLEREVSVAKEELEKDLANQLAKSQASFNKILAKEKKKVSALRRDRRNLTTARNAMIVALVKIWKDANGRDDEMSKLHAAAEGLDGDLKDLESENDELKEDMANKFVAGFQVAMEQVRVLFPDIDGDVLAQADFLKKVQDGELVSRLPA